MNSTTREPTVANEKCLLFASRPTAHRQQPPIALYNSRVVISVLPVKQR